MKSCMVKYIRILCFNIKKIFHCVRLLQNLTIRQVVSVGHSLKEKKNYEAYNLCFIKKRIDVNDVYSLVYT